MKVEVKKIDATRRELKFEVPKDRVSKTLEAVFQDIGKVAKIKGFRPGKAPRHLLESQHGSLAREEAIKKIIPEIYQEGIDQEKITPMDLPDIEDVSFKDGGITFTAKLDIRPEIKIKNYKGITIQRKSSQVTDEELNKTLEFFKKGQGDQDVTVDDAFVRGLGYPNLEDFKSSIRRQMEMDKDRQNRADVENQIIEHLLKESTLTVPQSAITKQLEHRMEDYQKRMKSQGIPAEEFQKKEEEMRKEMRPVAEKDIKVYLILDHIGKEEKITIAQNENMFNRVMEYLLREAKWNDGKS